MHSLLNLYDSDQLSRAFNSNENWPSSHEASKTWNRRSLKWHFRLTAERRPTCGSHSPFVYPLIHLQPIITLGWTPHTKQIHSVFSTHLSGMLNYSIGVTSDLIIQTVFSLLPENRETGRNLFDGRSQAQMFFSSHTRSRASRPLIILRRKLSWVTLSSETRSDGGANIQGRTARSQVFFRARSAGAIGNDDRVESRACSYRAWVSLREQTRVPAGPSVASCSLLLRFREDPCHTRAMSHDLHHGPPLTDKGPFVTLPSWFFSLSCRRLLSSSTASAGVVHVVVVVVASTPRDHDASLCSERVLVWHWFTLPISSTTGANVCVYIRFNHSLTFMSFYDISLLVRWLCPLAFCCSF